MGVASKVVDEGELDRPVVRRKALTVRNAGTTRSEVDCGEYGTFVTDEPIAHGGTGDGPSPLQTVLGALCGCESVTFHRTAEEFEFAYEGIDFDAAFTIDIRGREGNRAVRPHFQTVKVQATVTTDESEDRLREVVDEAEARCPVLNLVQDAGVDVEMVWVRRPTGQTD